MLLLLLALHLPRRHQCNAGSNEGAQAPLNSSARANKHCKINSRETPRPSEGATLLFINVTTLGAKARGYLATAPYDVVGVAEHHLTEREIPEQARSFFTQGWKTKWSPAELSVGGGTHGGVSWLARKAVHTSSSIELPGAHAATRERDVLTAAGQDWIPCFWRLKGLTVAVFVIYLNSSEGLSSGNVSKLDSLAFAVRQLHTAFIIIGDWNMTPQQLANSRWMESLGRAVKVMTPRNVSHTCTTPPGRMLDYAVIDNRLEPYVLKMEAVLNIPVRPHVGVAVTFTPRPRTVKVRTRVTPRAIQVPVTLYDYVRKVKPRHRPGAEAEDRAEPTFETVTREGPMRCSEERWLSAEVENQNTPAPRVPDAVREALAYQADPQAAETLGQTYRRWLATAETCLCRAAGEQDGAFKGRGERLNFKQKRAAPGKEFEHQIFKYRKSSWWTIVVARLRDAHLLRRKGQAITEAVLQMCRELSTRVPSFTGDAEEAAAKEEEWAFRLKHTGTLSSETLVSMVEEASREAATTLRSACRESAKAFALWAKTATEAGAKQAHAWTKRAVCTAVPVTEVVTKHRVHATPDELAEWRKETWESRWARDAPGPTLQALQQVRAAAKNLIASGEWQPLDVQEVDSAVRSIAEFNCVMKPDMEARSICVVEPSWPVPGWLIEHASGVQNKCLVGADGQTAYQRVKGGKRYRGGFLPLVAACSFALSGRSRVAWCTADCLMEPGYSSDEHLVASLADGVGYRARDVKESVDIVSEYELRGVTGRPWNLTTAAQQ